MSHKHRVEVVCRQDKPSKWVFGVWPMFSQPARIRPSKWVLGCGPEEVRATIRFQWSANILKDGEARKKSLDRKI